MSTSRSHKSLFSWAALGYLFGALTVSLLWFLSPASLSSNSLEPSDESAAQSSDSLLGIIEPGTQSAPTGEINPPEPDHKGMLISNPRVLQGLELDITKEFTSAKLSDTIVEILGLRPVEKKKVEHAIRDAVSAIREVESSLAEVRSTENGDEFYYIPAFYGDQGRQIERAFQNKLDVAIGAERGKVITHLIGPDPKFSNFGASAREVAFIDQGGDEVNIADPNFTFTVIESRILKEDGSQHSFQQSVLNTPLLEEMYGHFYR